MMSTISFKEIVKLVHPDHNPNIVDAGAKMALVVANRCNEVMLHNLGVQWGVIKATTAHQTQKTHARPTQPPPRPRSEDKKNADIDAYTMFRRANRIFQPGDVVYCRTKGCTVVITKVTDTRVYFIFNGKESYSAKKNVRFL